MKPIATVLGICTLLLLPTVALATNFVWDGNSGVDCFWSTALNWDIGAGCPSSTSDTATIDNFYAPPCWPVLDDDYTVTNGNKNIAALTMRDGTSGSPTQITTDDGTARKLEVTAGSGLFTVGGTAAPSYAEQLGSGEIECTLLVIDATVATNGVDDVTLKLSAGTLTVNSEAELNGSTSVDAEATLVISSGATFTPESLDVNGGTNTDREAVLDINQSVTVGDTGTTMAGYIDIYVNTSQTLDLDDITVDGTTTFLTLVTDGTCQGDTLTVDARTTDESRTFTKAGTGTLTVLNTTTLKGGTHDPSKAAIPDDATLNVSAGGFSTNDIVCIGGGYIGSHGDQGKVVVDFSVSPTITDDVLITGDVNFGGTANVTITDELGIGDGSDQSEMYKIGSGTVTAGRIVIRGDSSDKTALEIIAGSVVTN